MKTLIINEFKAIFWDFDGVIKDSVKIKSKAYLGLFENASEEIKSKIQDHHLKFGGISRFKKIPLYMEWAGINVTKESTEEYIQKFATIVEDAVVSSPWISGVEHLLFSKNRNQMYFVFTGTPQSEIESILRRLSLDKIFDGVYGAPTEKKDAIQIVLSMFNLSASDCLMIGDSETDLLAADQTGVKFWLRSDGDDEFSRQWSGIMLKDFKGIL